MISAALITSCIDSNHSDAVIDLAQSLASSGFCDTSRVGGGNPELGRMVAQFNQAELLRSLTIYQQNLKDLREIITNQDWEALEKKLGETQQARPNFLES